MNIAIEYVTEFSYGTPVRESQNIVRACPRDEPGQALKWYRLETDPHARIASHVDAWGTRVDRFGVREAHDALTVRASAEVDTAPRPVPPEGISDQIDDPYRLRHWSMLTRTSHTEWDESMAEAARSLVAGLERPIDIVRAVRDAVSERFEYRPGTTHVGIDVNDVWRSKSGVCQDFAHVSIALLRSQGIAARYVSGYLYAADPMHPGAVSERIETQTHAWVEAAIPGWGWWPVDPSNGGTVGERHVVIGRGRDYDDVSPIRGVYFGDSSHDLEAVVHMSEQ